MKIGITGHRGTIGKELLQLALEIGLDVVPLDFDITKPETIKLGKIDTLVHLAAETDVDVCEDDPLHAFQINVRGTGNLIEKFSENGKFFIYVSSDHVFSGGRGPYKESSRARPINAYGNSKYMGETIATMWPGRTVVVRSSKVFTLDTIKPTLNRIQSKGVVVISDVIKRSYLHARHFSEALLYLLSIISTFPYDIINIAGTETVSHYRFWQDICIELDIDASKVVPRLYKLSDLTPRPYSGGLVTKLARKMGFPLYSYKDGIELLKAEYDAGNNC